MCLGLPGQIIEITDADKRLAKVNVAGIKREINIACILDVNQSPEETIGQWVLVHVGFAMARINEEEARRTLDLLQELGEAQEQIKTLQQG